jgi:Domain of unknown function (DUF4126)
VNELLAAILVGILLSISAGVRITVPLLALNLLAFEHVIRLPDNLAWLGTQTTLILLGAAFVVETTVHFIPAAGTALKAAATPLAFVAGTLLMAVPLGDKNPLFQWILAGSVGGGAATLTHLGFTGMRAATGPVNLASGGIFGIGWNLLELLGSLFFIVLSGICVVAGWLVGGAILVVLGGLVLLVMWKAMRQWRERAEVA